MQYDFQHLLVDSHVHFHPCFSCSAFLDSAARNFRRARTALGLRTNSLGCLVFVESANADDFLRCRNGLAGRDAPGWRTASTGEDGSFVVSRGDETILIVRARQIVTAERLEVLAVGCSQKSADGEPVHQLLRGIAESRGIAILPWGFGKWWGSRGRIVQNLIKQSTKDHFFIGDNGGRLRLTPRPPLFRRAEQMGLIVLPGSDPLAIPNHVHRAGSYGFLLSCEAGITAPGTGALVESIRRLRKSPVSFGGLSSWWFAVRSQIALRLTGQHVRDARLRAASQ
jgi:hypothetical protein